ncbi:MAG: hypothetical protein LH614_21340 [Pyrinomonadaceae bacterium]|nr:hypothetical protein [Pyrinomonadaceae bacterium]
MNLAGKIFILLAFFACFQIAKADWVKQNSNTLAWLSDVYFLNEQDGWIVGSGGTYLKTLDGGKNWTKEKNFTADNLRQIYFTDEKTGWLLCERDLYTLGANSPSYLLKTIDGGVNWERVEFADSQRKRVTKFFFTKNGAGLAVGEVGALFALADDKKNWKRTASPARYLLSDGTFTDDLNGAVVGAGGTILFTADAGSSWNKASIFGSEDAKLNAVFFINQKNGWTVGANGKIFQTVNGGKIWREQQSNVAADLTDIFFTNTANGWAVGEQGAILRTETAGNVWTKVKSNTKHKLEKVFFVGKKGFAVGFGGTILFYDENNPPSNAALPPPRLRTRNQ